MLLQPREGEVHPYRCRFPSEAAVNHAGPLSDADHCRAVGGSRVSAPLCRRCYPFKNLLAAGKPLVEAAFSGAEPDKFFEGGEV